MNFKNITVFCFSVLACSTCFAQFNPLQYVDPFIGTANDANTYPGAKVPWGMVAVNPFNIDTRSTPASTVSYRKGEENIFGFSHTILSGVGCPDMGSILLMPSHGKVTADPDSLKSAYSNEQAAAGYYAVNLNKYNINAALSATVRSGISKYTFSQPGNSFIAVNISAGLSKKTGAYIHKLTDTEIEGYKTEGGFCGKDVAHQLFFYLKINKQSAIQLWDTESTKKKSDSAANAVGAWITFNVKRGESVLVKVGISYVSTANAKLNCEQEQPLWNFEDIKQRAAKAWMKQLSKIKVQGENVSDKTIFYTAIYHILQHPNIINDVNGEYPAMGTHKTMRSKRDHYTIYSLWDTYRNVHPFLTLIYPERQADMVASMIDMYKETGWLPKWELAANETYVMVGDPALPVITDTYIKGVRNFDVAAAYSAMKKNSSLSQTGNPVRPGLKQYLNNGFIPNDDKGDVWGSVSTTLEYSFADWSLAQMARAMGKKKDYATYMERAHYYKNVYNPAVGFMQPKLKNKQWQLPFSPVTINGELGWNSSGGPGFVEGSAWQYTWFVPHDIQGLKYLMGGDKAFTSKLQKCFDSSYFDLWNEPDMAYPYLFNYVPGEEWRSQREVTAKIKRYFNTTAGGIPGNDDCGTLSAWLVFGMMGFYPDCPGSSQYAMTLPSFKKISIYLNPQYYRGKVFTITKEGSGGYVQSMFINNRKSEKYFLKHAIITGGGVLNFTTENR